MWTGILLAFALASSESAPSTITRSKAIMAGPVQVDAATSKDYALQIAGTMEQARLKGTLRAVGGTGNDIEVSVFRQSDYVNWKNGHEAAVLFKSGRSTIAEIDLALEPGTYQLVLSNHFSAFTSKTVRGSVTLTWAEDASLPFGAALRDRVTFKKVPPQTKRLEVPFRASPNAGTVVIERDGEFGPYTVTVRRPRGTTILEKNVGIIGSDRLVEVGTVDVDSDAIEDVFTVSESAGSGAASKELSVVSTSKLQIVSLTLFQTYQATAATAEVTYSENFGDPALAIEGQFLERIKSAYAATDESEVAHRDDDPKFIFYAWAKDNGAVENGPLTVRRYPGKPAEFGSINDQLTDGSVTYYALFKAGVIAYDASTNEHYALFHPKDMYAWPTVLKKLGPYLLIGTRGEGLVIVDTGKMALKRVRLVGANEVERIEIIGSKIRINGSAEIDAPAY